MEITWKNIEKPLKLKVVDSDFFIINSKEKDFVDKIYFKKIHIKKKNSHI